MPTMRPPSIFAALVTVHCGGGQTQTGWFFTDSGHILTCAHGFEVSEVRIGDLVKVVRQNDRRSMEARVVEIGSSRLDYAILQVTPSPQRTHFFRITTKWDGSLFRARFYSAGFAHAIEDTPTEFQGSIGSQRIRPHENRIQMRMEPVFSAEGLSGCPIILDANNEVVALQVAQPDAAQGMLFGIPLERVWRHSLTFKHEIQKIRSQTFPLEWDVFSLDARLFPSPKLPKQIGRSAFLLKESGDRSPRENLLSYIRERWPSLCERLRATRDNLGTRAAHAPIVKPVLIVGNVLSPGAPAAGHLTAYLSPDFRHAPQPTSDVRVVLDLSGQVSLIDGPQMEDVNGLSHLIGVTIGDNKLIVKSSINRIDSVYVVPAPDISQAATGLINIVEDIATDILLFYSTRIVPALFGTTSLRRAFSESKIAYARQYSLMSYGMKIPDGIRYISLASCCRRSLLGSMDLDELQCMWHDFVDRYLLVSLSERERAETPRATRQQVYATILAHPRLGGHIPAKLLWRRLERFDAKPGELCAVAVTKKPPATRAEVSALGHLFRMRQLRRSQPYVFRQHEIAGLLRFRPCVYIFVFRWRA